MQTKAPKLTSKQKAQILGDLPSSYGKRPSPAKVFSVTLRKALAKYLATIPSDAAS
jgi:hypothetical protein